FGRKTHATLAYNNLTKHTKRTIIEPGMARELQEIVDETDNRPMRALGHRTPAEAFADELPDLQL
ncbi:MAG: hypothetical protein U0N99_07285, partial [Collinsella sp.]